MSWFAKNARVIRVAAGAVAGTGVVAVAFGSDVISRFRRKDNFTYPLEVKKRDAFFSSKQPLNTVLASYTTNFEPSQKWDYNWDRRDPKSLVKPPKEGSKPEDYENAVKQKTPKASRHIFLIRHGQYHLDGATDKERFLTELGREQARFTGQRLKELNHPFTVLVNSTMTRAQETADIISEHLPSVPRHSCDLLREGAPYPPEPPIGGWRPESSQFYTDGARIEAAFRKHIHRADTSQEDDSFEVFPCHGNVIRYFVCRALQFPPESWLRLGIYHGSITHLVVRPSGRVSLRTYGDAGYMPVAKVTSC